MRSGTREKLPFSLVLETGGAPLSRFGNDALDLEGIAAKGGKEKLW